MMAWKKWISIMMAVVVFLTFGTMGYAESSSDVASNSIKVSSEQGYPGDFVDISVHLTPEDLINHYDISIGFDESTLALVPGNEVTDELGVISDEGVLNRIFLVMGRSISRLIQYSLQKQIQRHSLFISKSRTLQSLETGILM